MPFLWSEDITDYQADNVAGYQEILEVKRLNFFIGRNNAGKSRFLRHLLLSTHKFSYYQSHPFDFNKFKQDLEANFKNTIGRIHEGYNYNRINNIVINNTSFTNQQDALTHFSDFVDSNLPTLNFPFLPQKNKLQKLIENTQFIISGSAGRYSLNTINIEQYYSLQEVTDCENNLYIPILRGMRPVSDNLQVSAYQNRNVKDYEIEAKSIITGENLYKELQERLLGEPEDRQLIQDYQNVLSRYFFDNETITLIPKINHDVVHIKIGDAKQFPIYHLGDGLQQAIILTYDAFLRKDEIHAYFVEEPELHMHAGMVRQLMNFYLHETQHYYFFTTHSNHLLDMADESDEVMIQKFSKQKTTDENGQEQTFFQINLCDRDRELLQSLGVKPSSVYLANCTIWVEGITDRLYLIKYMERYLKELESENPEKYAQYRRFMLHYHYAFVEYAGSNMVHWSFENAVNDVDGLEDNGLSARAVASNMLLIADADTDKGQRIKILNKELGTNKFHLLKVKEIENTLPKGLIVQVAKNRFKHMQSKTKNGFDIELLNDETAFDFNDVQNGIGVILDNVIRKPRTQSNKRCFSTESGTIKDKLNFCREVLKIMDDSDWQLTDHARKLAERIFKHIEEHNQ